MGANTSVSQLNYISEQHKCYSSVLTSGWIAAPLVLVVQANKSTAARERGKLLPSIFVVVAFISAWEHYAVKISCQKRGKKIEDLKHSQFFFVTART